MERGFASFASYFDLKKSGVAVPEVVCGGEDGLSPLG
jgi:hypothetical protein